MASHGETIRKSDFKPFTVKEISALPDPLLAFSYVLRFNDFPVPDPNTGTSLFSWLVGMDIGRKIEGLNSSDRLAKSLSIRCKSVEIPGAELLETTVELYGHKVKYAVGLETGGTMSVEFYTEANLMARNALITWMEMAKNDFGQVGNFRNQQGQVNKTSPAVPVIGLNSGSLTGGYACTCDLVLFDPAGIPSAAYRMYGVWPLSISGLSLSGGSSENPNLSATFNVDWWSPLTLENTGSGHP